MDSIFSVILGDYFFLSQTWMYLILYPDREWEDKHVNSCFLSTTEFLGIHLSSNGRRENKKDLVFY